jgi:hypothetical protein
VLSESRLFASLTFDLSLGLSRICGDNRSFENALPISTVGWTIKMGAGSISMKYCDTFSKVVVLIICELHISTTLSTERSSASF